MPRQSNKPARAVVLAAGQGKRMKSAKAKVLHDVLGKPIIKRILDALDLLGLEKIHVVVGHQAEQVIDYLHSNPPKTDYTTHIQSPQLGTGHALQQVTSELKSYSGTLLVTVGDAPLLTAETLGGLIDKHQNESAVVSLLTTIVDDPRNYGRIVRDSAGNVQSIVEDKDCTQEQKAIRETNPAIYGFEWPAIESGLNSLRNDNKQKEYYLTDLVAWARSCKLKLSSFLAPDYREVAGINSRVELVESIGHLRDRVVRKLMLDSGVTVLDPLSTWIAPEVQIGEDSTVLPGCNLIGDIRIGSGCEIGPGTVMNGIVEIGDGTCVVQSLVVNSKIGQNCKIGPWSHIREHSDIGAQCRIGNFVELKKAEFGSSTNSSHLSYVGDATVGSGANIGAGTITANYDHITKAKNRTTLGDGVSTGSNSVLVAPVVIGKDAVVAAGSVVNKDVPDGALAVARARQVNMDGWAEKRRKSCK